MFVLSMIYYYKYLILTISINEPSIISLGLFFLKIGSVLYGSGYVLIAFLQGEIVDSFHWITQQQLLDSIAVGQFTPGPILSTATFIGYLIKGILGATVSTLCIFLPSFIFVLLLIKYVDKLRSNKTISIVLDGVNGGSLGLMCAVVIKLGVILI